MRSKQRPPQSEQHAWPMIWGIGAALVLLLALVIWFSTRSQPQLAYDAEVFNTVDALFTAVTSKDSQRLAACEERLDKYAAEGRMPTSAARVLDGIVEEAKEGSWEPAAKRLYAFMLGQRRES